MEFFYFLDLFGTAIFAITGSLKAFKHQLDLLGVLVLGLTTGIGGGTIREILLDHNPPFLLKDSNYFYIAMGASFLTFIFRKKIMPRENWFLIFDAIGLGVFVAIGSLAAFQAGLGVIGISFSGVLTAVGGGVLRDIFVREVPLIFQREVYATAAIVGTFMFQILLQFNFNLIFAMTISAVSTIIIRLIAIHFNLNLPRAI